MNENIKKWLGSLLKRTLICVLMFFVLMGVKHFIPLFFDKCTNVWTKSSQLTELTKLSKEMIKELLPW